MTKQTAWLEQNTHPEFTGLITDIIDEKLPEGYLGKIEDDVTTNAAQLHFFGVTAFEQDIDIYIERGLKATDGFASVAYAVELAWEPYYCPS